VDVSLKGTSVEPDVDDMEAAYGEGTTPADVLQVRKSASACVLWPTQCSAQYWTVCTAQAAADNLCGSSEHNSDHAVSKVAWTYSMP
jgi:hypothetical protein